MLSSNGSFSAAEPSAADKAEPKASKSQPTSNKGRQNGTGKAPKTRDGSLDPQRLPDTEADNKTDHKAAK